MSGVSPICQGGGKGSGSAPGGLRLQMPPESFEEICEEIGAPRGRPAAWHHNPGGEGGGGFPSSQRTASPSEGGGKGRMGRGEESCFARGPKPKFANLAFVRKGTVHHTVRRPAADPAKGYSLQGTGRPSPHCAPDFPLSFLPWHLPAWSRMAMAAGGSRCF